MFLILLLLTPSAYALDPKYGPAVQAIRDASYAQSGFEADVAKVKHATLGIANKWVYYNGLTTVVAVGGVAANAYLYKIVRLRTGDFTVEGWNDHVQGSYGFPF